ncbi:MAG: hypothetical protein CL927_09090 [Deltaproteobacteria bacterium]|nr:hypothetical protein [Deltaproteobacteria bacterium]HCH61277.1 hypothetical protein [Deltaproteobacteria bacterium]
MSAAARITARHVWTPAGLRSHCAVTIDADQRVVSVDEASPGESLLNGILMPGFVNANGRLEQSHHRRPLGPAGAGRAAWRSRLAAATSTADHFTAERGARAARASGTAFFIDVSPTGGTAEAMAVARLRGTMLVECSGWSIEQWRPALAVARARARASTAHVQCRPTAHAPSACAPDLLRAALVRGVAPVTIHCDEDAGDASGLADRIGSWAELPPRLAGGAAGDDWLGHLGTTASGVALLHALELLAPHLGLVHLTAAGDADLDRIAESGCTAVLCPRSNLHITGRLPDVPGMVRRGIPLALGTDSCASVRGLDLLADAAVLRAAFPRLPVELWVRALTEGGASLLSQRSDAGRIVPGARPDLLLVEVADDGAPLERLLDGTRWPRRWLT